MTDFIHHNEQAFLSLMGCEQDEKLVNRLADILDKYQCFHDYTSFTSYKSKKMYHHHHHHQQTLRRKISNPNFSNVEREITALLNKISRTNYKTIAKQILSILNTDNIEVMVANVLDKCQKQTCFLDLYMSLMMEINQKASFNMKNNMADVLSTFIDEFITKREFDCYQLDGENYEQFCSNISNKKNILGKHRTVLELMVKILKDNHIDEYFDSMFNEMVEMDHLDDTIDTRNIHDKRELVLEILKDFTLVNDKYQVVIQKYYSNNNDVLELYSLKAKFKVMDITQIKLVR